MEGLSTFLPDWGSKITAIVALIALIQPWCIDIWKRFFRPGHVAIYETGPIEIGYSAIGPTIGLLGTLKACHRDFFIQSMLLIIEKEKDHSLHQFGWVVFRSPKLTFGAMGKTEEVALEIPAGFMVITSQPHRFNILFSDQARQDEIRPILMTVQRAWFHYFWNVLGKQAPTAQDYQSFQTQQEHVTAFTNLDRLFYWEPGKYRLKLTLQAEGSKTFSKSWSFSLTPQEEQILRLNPLAIMLETCNQPQTQYNFAYPRYQNL